MLQSKNQTSSTAIWCLTIYAILSFYYFGVIMTNYMIVYPTFPKVHENYQHFLGTFNQRMNILMLAPSLLMMIAGVFLVRFNNEKRDRVILASSLGLCCISIFTAFIIITPIHQTLANAFDELLFQRLLQTTIFFQIIPMALQLCLLIWILNKQLKETSLSGRWIFILFFALTFYTFGTSYSDVFLSFPLYLAVGETDWMAYRTAVEPAAFFGTFLIPAYLPLFLILPMYWKRPKGIPRYFITLYTIGLLWIVFISATYFVPHIQVALSQGYSRALIEELLMNEVPLREYPSLLMFVMVALMLVRSRQASLQE